MTLVSSMQGGLLPLLPTLGVCGRIPLVLISLETEEATAIALDLNIYILNYKAGRKFSDSSC